MRVTMRGFSRDRGTWILAEDELTDSWPQPKFEGCPSKGFSLEYTKEGEMVTGINFKKRVPVNMNGNYILEIALSPADVVFLCWFAFRERALSALLRIFGEHEAFEKKVEDETTKARENRLNRRL